jgi:guanine nucleotide-binding protein subunit alpha
LKTDCFIFIKLSFFFSFPLLQAHIPLFQDFPVIKKGQPYPDAYRGPLKQLWHDKGVQQAYEKGNTFALNDNVI